MVKIGRNCKIQGNAYIPEGVRIGNNVFVGPGVTFTNVKHPMKMKPYEQTIVRDDVIIGAGSTILPGITLYKKCFIGAGAVVTKSVKPSVVVCGNPAREMEGKWNF